MHSGEPMVMGSPLTSPASPTSPGPGDRSSYLPGFLLGDPAPHALSSTPRLWSSSTGSTATPPRPSTNKSAVWSTPSNLSGISETPRSTSRVRDLMEQRPKEKPGGPPVAGLLEQISTPELSHSRLELSGRTHHLHGTPQFHADLSTREVVTPGSQSRHAFGTSGRTPPSPAQVDPFYTQGEAIRPDDELDETWITVFGFPPGATSFILQQFSQYGNILKHVIAPEGNWLHLHYQSKLQAKKALSKNGKVFGSSIMVGVSRCIDKNVMDSDKENVELVSRTSIYNTPTHLHPGVADLNNTSSIHRGTPVRPLTAAYKAVSSEHDVVQTSSTPQKSNNIFSKAMEYMFGW